MNDEKQLTGLPDWEFAPEWANYCAMDSNAQWFWYEFEPIKSDDHFWRVEIGRYCPVILDGKKWKNSLQQRPQP